MQILKPLHTTKPNEIAGIKRDVQVAMGAPREVGAKVPIAAAQNTVGQRPGRSLGIAATGIWRLIPIPTPRNDIPNHVIEPIPVRRKGFYRTGRR